MADENHEGAHDQGSSDPHNVGDGEQVSASDSGQVDTNGTSHDDAVSQEGEPIDANGNQQIQPEDVDEAAAQEDANGTPHDDAVSQEAEPIDANGNQQIQPEDTDGATAQEDTPAEEIENNAPAQHRIVRDFRPSASNHYGGEGEAFGFEYEIIGHNRPDLRLLLNPGFTFYTEGNASVKDASGAVYEGTSLGYGHRDSFWSSFRDAVIRKLLVEENFVLTKLQNKGKDPLAVTIRAPYRGDLIAINLDEIGGELICKPGHFFAAPMGVEIGWKVDLNPLSLIFGEQTLLWQTIKAPSKQVQNVTSITHDETGREIKGTDNPTSNWVFLHSFGDVTVRDIPPERDEAMRVNRGSVLGFAPHIKKTFGLVKQGFIANAWHLMNTRDNETIWCPKYKSPSEEVCEKEGACRIWTAYDTF